MKANYSMKKIKEKQNKVRKVLIATPSFDGRVDVWYANAVINTIRIAQANGIFIQPIFLSYDALVQRARNDLIQIAIEEKFDDMFFIDSDIEFNPMWVMELLNRKEDVIGGAYRKKTDDVELYAIKTENLNASRNSLIKVDSMGLGFVKLSRKAFTKIWEVSEEYENEGKKCRMVCNIGVIDGQLYSEDFILFKKLKESGFDVWLHPGMTCAHIGNKKFYGDIANAIKQIKESEKKTQEKTGT